MTAMRRRLWGVVAIAVVAVALTAWWAARAIPEPQIPPSMSPTPELLAAQKADAREEPPLAASDFTVTLWRSPAAERPPAPNANAPATPVETPLRLELIGVVLDGDRRLAALYDPKADKLSLVADGQRVGAYTVQRVTSDIVTLLDGARPRDLRMKRADQ